MSPAAPPPHSVTVSCDAGILLAMLRLLQPTVSVWVITATIRHIEHVIPQALTAA